MQKNQINIGNYSPLPVLYFWVISKIWPKIMIKF